MADESKYPTRIAPYGLRMPDDLKARVQAAAEANNRSMNAEIVATLEEKYPAPDRFDLGTFITEWSASLSAAADPDEVRRLVGIANSQLEDNRSEWRLHASMGIGGVSVHLVRPVSPNDPTPTDD